MSQSTKIDWAYDTIYGGAYQVDKRIFKMAKKILKRNRNRANEKQDDDCSVVTIEIPEKNNRQ